MNLSPTFCSCILYELYYSAAITLGVDDKDVLLLF